MKADPVAYPNHVTFRFVFKRYAAAHLVEEAMNAYYRTEEFNLRDETSYSNLIDALCEYKHVIEAEELFLKESKDLVFNDDVKIYNIILRGWFKMGWWKKCRSFGKRWIGEVFVKVYILIRYIWIYSARVGSHGGP